MDGSIPLALILLAGIVALCWADLGKKQADASNEYDDFPETLPPRLDQRLREAGE